MKKASQVCEFEPSCSITMLDVAICFLGKMLVVYL